MSDVRACMIVPASLAPLARALAAGLSDRGVGMFEVGLSATGDAPATHFISVGMIDAQIRDLLTVAMARRGLQLVRVPL